MTSRALVGVVEAGAWPRPITADLAYLRTAIVNVFFFGERGAAPGEWVLIDAGVYGTAHRIVEAAERRFGAGTRPAAIVLTHGHFDHIGALQELAEHWDVPVYAHPLELPYLTGRSAYPPPDPSVGGGAMARLSFLYPRGPIDIGARVRPLPRNGTIPRMPGWRWIHTPGHTAGHISLFRDDDGLLVAGDAVITTRQESALAVLSQKPELNGPPMYYTPDWGTAWHSVRKLAALEPAVLATGHGVPLAGSDMLRDLRILARRFDRLAIPERGRYVRNPALADENGVFMVPPRPTRPLVQIAVGVSAALLVGLAWKAASKRANGRGSS